MQGEIWSCSEIATEVCQQLEQQTHFAYPLCSAVYLRDARQAQPRRSHPEPSLVREYRVTKTTQLRSAQLKQRLANDSFLRHLMARNLKSPSSILFSKAMKHGFCPTYLNSQLPAA